jgi:hypothetical protein
VVVLGDRQSELGEDAAHVFLDGALGDEEATRDAAVRAALGHQLQHLLLPCGQLGERVVAALQREQLLDERRIDDGAAACDALHGVREVGDVRHAALEQIADPIAAVEQLHRRLDLDMRREEQDPRLGQLLANCCRCVEPLGRVRRWHADVHDNEVRLVLPHQRKELGGVASLPHDLVALVGQQPRDPLTQKNIVVRHHEPAVRHLTAELTSCRRRRVCGADTRLRRLR